MDKKPIKVSTFTYNGQDIEVTLARGKIAYVYELGSNRYGGSVKPAGSTKKDYVDASFALFINYLENYAKASKRTK